MKKKILLGLLTVPLLALSSCSFSVYGATLKYNHTESDIDAKFTEINKSARDLIKEQFSNIDWEKSSLETTYANADAAIKDMDSKGKAAVEKKYGDLKIVFAQKGTLTADVTSGGTTKTLKYVHTDEESTGQYVFKDQSDSEVFTLWIEKVYNNKVESAKIYKAGYAFRLPFKTAPEGYPSYFDVSYFPILTN